jgi:hypothetical protein
MKRFLVANLSRLLATALIVVVMGLFLTSL